MNNFSAEPLESHQFATKFKCTRTYGFKTIRSNLSNLCGLKRIQIKAVIQIQALNFDKEIIEFVDNP